MLAYANSMCCIDIFCFQRVLIVSSAAGWTPRSNMHYKYVRGNESEEDLLRVKGIIKDNKESVNILTPKICPFFKTSNTPDAQFCQKCNFVISFEVYQKSVEGEKKDQEIREVKELVEEIRLLCEDLINRDITVRN